MEGLEAIFRWLHVLAGIVWIGHLYFFNWVNGPFQAKIDGPTKKIVNPELMPRALYWFRWGAAYTWITGVLLLGLVYYMGEQALASGAGWSAAAIIMIAVTFLGVFLYDALWKSGLANNLRAAVIVSFVLGAIIIALFVHFAHFSYRGTLIHTAALFGTIMAFNVWFRIWPAQQKIIRATKNGEAADANVVKLAGLRSRHNTYMSVPLLWGMIGQHTTYFAGGNLGPSASSGNSPIARANTGTDACALGCFLSAASPDYVVFGSCYRTGNAVHDKLSQFKAQLRRSFQAARIVDFGNTAPNVGAAGNHFNAALRNRFVQHSDKGIAKFVGLAVDAVDHSNHDFRTRRNRPTGVCRVRRRRSGYAFSTGQEPRVRARCCASRCCGVR